MKSPIKSVKGIQREDSAPYVEDDEVTLRRRKEMLEGKCDDPELLEEWLRSPDRECAPGTEPPHSKDVPG